MSFTFENQGTNTYLVYEIGTADELDTMSLGMLTNNTIPGLAAASFTQMDTTKYIKFNVSAKVSVSQLFSGAVNKKRLVGVFSGIISAMLAAEDYMLDPNSLLLDLDYIFADVTTCETVVVCLPIMNTERRNPDLSMFFKNIIFNTQFDQTENCDHVAQILNYLNSNPALSLTDFKDLLDKVAKTSTTSKTQTKPATETVRTVTTQEKIQPTVTSQTVDVVKEAKTTTQQTPPKHENLQFGPNYNAAGKSGSGAQVDISSVPKAPQVENTKPMSMFYLLQHYSKENAAIYKAQQEAKKGKKGAATPAVQQTKTTQQKKATQTGSAGFAVPGKEEPIQTSFAVPNQQQQQVAPVQQTVKPQQNVVPQQERQETAPVQQQVIQSQTSHPINFGETTVLGGSIGETTVLGAAAMPNKADPHLIRAKNNEKIPLNKPVFRIGKERSYVDYFISDNTAISRGHANIVDHNGEYFVVDTNSTNHTYLNGVMVQPGVETKLAHGDKVRLANEDFEFRLY